MTWRQDGGGRKDRWKSAPRRSIKKVVWNKCVELRRKEEMEERKTRKWRQRWCGWSNIGSGSFETKIISWRREWEEGGKRRR